MALQISSSGNSTFGGARRWEDGGPDVNQGKQVGKPGKRQVTLPHVSVPRGDAELEGVITVDRYDGTESGRNGKHELLEGTLSLVNANSNPSAVDTTKVQVAMNVASNKDPEGLPSVIPLQPGDQIEVEGQYIPASRASTGSSHEAVIHFTHAPDGYVITPDGTEYA